MMIGSSFHAPGIVKLGSPGKFEGITQDNLLSCQNFLYLLRESLFFKHFFDRVAQCNTGLISLNVLQKRIHVPVN